jgi:O-antigen/teichoic acid export membrane protein
VKKDPAHNLLHGLKISSILYVSQIFLFIASLISKNILGPEYSGMWSTLLAIILVLSLFDLGVIQAANKEISFNLEKNRWGIISRLKNSMATFAVISGLVGSILVITFVFIFDITLDSIFLQSLFVILLFMPLYQYILAKTSIFWAFSNFTPTNLAVFIETAVLMLVGIPLIYFYSIYGQLAAFMLVLICKVYWLTWSTKKNPTMVSSFKVDFYHYSDLLRKGLPLQLINCVNIFRNTFPIISVSYFYGFQSAGSFALAFSLNSFILWIPLSFSIFLFPSLQRQFAEENSNPEVLRSSLLGPIGGLAFLVFPLVMSGSSAVMPVFLAEIFPEFKDSEILFLLLLCSSFYMGLEITANQILVTTNSHRLNAALSIMIAFLLLLACTLPSLFSLSFISVAWGVAVVSMFAALTKLYLALRVVRDERKKATIWIYILVPSILSFASVFINWHLFNIVFSDQKDVFNYFVFAGLNIIFFTTVSAVLGEKVAFVVSNFRKKIQI